MKFLYLKSRNFMKIITPKKLLLVQMIIAFCVKSNQLIEYISYAVFIKKNNFILLLNS